MIERVMASRRTYAIVVALWALAQIVLTHRDNPDARVSVSKLSLPARGPF